MLNWGFISTAEIGIKAKGAIDKSGLGKVVAVASRSVANAQKFVDKISLAGEQIKAYGTYEELFSDPSVSAVYVPLPSGIKKEWAIRAARAGKHVLCEKPFSSAKEVEEIADACRESKVLFMDGTMFVHNPRTEEVRRMLREGELGKVNQARTIFSFVRPEDLDNIRVNKELEPLGALGDVGWYAAKAMLITFGFELPVRVYASANYFNGVVNHLNAVLDFAGERMATLSCGFNFANQQLWSINGTLKSLNIDGFVIPWTAEPIYFPGVGRSSLMPLSLRGCDGVEEVRSIDLGEEPQEVRMYRCFATAAGQGHHAGSEGEGRRLVHEALLTQKLLDALALSAEKRAPVELH